MITPDELAEAKRLCEEAADEIEMIETGDAHYGYGSATHEPSPRSAAFYAAARTLVPRLLAEMERLRVWETVAFQRGETIDELVKERDEARRIADELARELERWRHGKMIEGDYVCAHAFDAEQTAEAIAAFVDSEVSGAGQMLDGALLSADIRARRWREKP